MFLLTRIKSLLLVIWNPSIHTYASEFNVLHEVLSDYFAMSVNSRITPKQNQLPSVLVHVYKNTVPSGTSRKGIRAV